MYKNGYDFLKIKKVRYNFDESCFFFCYLFLFLLFLYIYVFANVYTFTRSYEYINKRNRIFSPFKVYRANAFIVIPNAENRIFPSRLRPWTISATCKHKNIRNIRTKFAFVYLYTFVYIYSTRLCGIRVTTKPITNVLETIRRQRPRRQRTCCSWMTFTTVSESRHLIVNLQYIYIYMYEKHLEWFLGYLISTSFLLSTAIICPRYFS